MWVFETQRNRFEAILITDFQTIKYAKTRANKIIKKIIIVSMNRSLNKNLTLHGLER